MNHCANPGDWCAHAACIGKGKLMDTPRTQRARPRTRQLAQSIDAARTICRSCPVRQPCFEWAMTDPDPAFELMAGAHTYQERVALRQRTRRSVA